LNFFASLGNLTANQESVAQAKAREGNICSELNRKIEVQKGNGSDCNQGERELLFGGKRNNGRG